MGQGTGRQRWHFHWYPQVENCSDKYKSSTVQPCLVPKGLSHLAKKKGEKNERGEERKGPSPKALWVAPLLKVYLAFAREMGNGKWEMGTGIDLSTGVANISSLSTRQVDQGGKEGGGMARRLAGEKRRISFLGATLELVHRK
jgi:hypothetical protein